jgi:hypothetical protein
VQLTACATDRFSNWPLVQLTACATDRLCNWPPVLCNWPPVHLTACATDRLCNWPPVQLTACATDRLCNWPPVQLTARATDRFCNWPLREGGPSKAWRRSDLTTGLFATPSVRVIMNRLGLTPCGRHLVVLVCHAGRGHAGFQRVQSALKHVKRRGMPCQVPVPLNLCKINDLICEDCHEERRFHCFLPALMLNAYRNVFLVAGVL